MFALSTAASRSSVTIPRPEVELLLCCARTNLDEPIASRIADLLGHDLDWPHLLQLASWHQVLPLVYWNLNLAGADTVPASILSRLRNSFYTNLQRNLFLSTTLFGLLRLFQAGGIAAIPFKGPVLAATAYGNLAFRQSADLDILVPERDVLRARTLLMSKGYRPTFPTTSAAEVSDLLAWTFAQERAYLQTFCEQHFTDAGALLTVDLHWSVTPRFFFPLDTEQVLSRLQTVSLCGSTVQMPAAEEMLLILCAAGAKDCWPQLNRICDVAEVVRSQPELDWEHLLRRARSVDARRMLLLGLYLAHHLLGTTLPELISQRIRADASIRRLASQVASRLFPEVVPSFRATESFGHDLGSTLFHLRVRDSVWGRIHYCGARALTPNYRDWSLLRLPPSLSVLHYPLRPIRLLRMHGPRAVYHLHDRVARFTTVIG